MNKNIIEKLTIEYNKLNDLVYILGISDENFEIASQLFFKKPKEAVKEFLGFDDLNDEVNEYSVFVYYYIEANYQNLFYNIGKKNYTSKIKNFTKKYINNIDSIIDFDFFEKNENLYSEILLDILVAKIDVELRKSKKTILSISVGLKNVMFLILDSKEYLEIKKLNLEILSIYDISYLENHYGEIYEITNAINEFSEFLNKGDFIMKEKDKNEVYGSLFDGRMKKNIIINNLTKEQKKLLKIVL